MAINRDDQNTFIMIFAILIVCIIGVVAVINSFWLIIKAPLENVIAEIQKFIPVRRNYNFIVPSITPELTLTPENTPTPTTEAVISPTETTALVKALNYNFSIDTNTQILPVTFSKEAKNTLTELYEKFKEAGFEQLTQGNISIPRLNVSSEISNNIQGKFSGFKDTSGRYLFCLRTAATCSFIDRLQSGDEIYIEQEIFAVKGKGSFSPNLESVVEESEEIQIKMITLDRDQNKVFVVYAK